MAEDKNKSFCENSNITQSEEYKEFSRDIFLNTALESPDQFHHLSMMTIHEELIDELYPFK